MTERKCACGKVLRPYNKIGLCTPCTDARTCATCPSKLSRAADKLCRTCTNRAASLDPARRALRQAGHDAYFGNPAVKQKCADNLARNIAADPKRWKDGNAKGRAKANAKRKAAVWYPPEFAYLNKKLRDNHFPLAERKQVIAMEVAKREQARLASMTKFERDMERVKAGATLSERVDMRARDYEFSITGSSMAGM